jgi:hypothetical protein
LLNSAEHIWDGNQRFESRHPAPYKFGYSTTDLEVSSDLWGCVFIEARPLRLAHPIEVQCWPLAIRTMIDRAHSTPLGCLPSERPGSYNSAPLRGAILAVLMGRRHSRDSGVLRRLQIRPRYPG